MNKFFFLVFVSLEWKDVLLLRTNAFTVLSERRTFVLMPWSSDGSGISSLPSLGWATEERVSSSVGSADSGSSQLQGSWTFTVAWNGEPNVSVHLPWNADNDADMQNVNITDDLSTSLWVASVASAILCRSPKMVDRFKGKHVLELGSGVGLTGWVAGTSALSTTLTDHDQRAVNRLNKAARQNQGNFSAHYLEWKDDHNNAAISYDIILASDVAYYFYLLRPLMDTIKARLGSLAIVTGQANRQSQWDLYENIKSGCYNQITDEREAPWSGQTLALLYNLGISKWGSEDEDSVELSRKFESVVPIAVIYHDSSPGSNATKAGVFSDMDCVATEADKESILISF